MQRIGIREPMPAGMVHRPRGGDDILIMAFHGDACIDGDAVIPGPSARAWPRRAPHRYGDPWRPWMHSWLHVRSDTFASALGREGVPLDRPIPGFRPEPFEHLLRLLHAECAGHVRPDPAVVTDLLQVLARLLRRCATPAMGGPMTPEISLLCQEMHAHPGASWNVPRMARMCGMSESRFAHRFRATMGTPPVEYLIRLRLHRARQLLAEPERPIHLIAAEVGYTDTPHFYRIFKQRFGMAPGMMRR